MTTRVPLYIDHTTGLVTEVLSTDLLPSSNIPGGGSGGGSSVVFSSSTALVVSTPAATSLMPGITSIPSANQAPGNIYAIHFDGTASWATLASTLTFTVALGASTLLTWAPAGSSIPYLLASGALKVRADLQVFASNGIGGSATVKIKGQIELDGGLYQGKPVYLRLDVDESATVNTTIANALQITATWSAAGGNTLTVDEIVEWAMSSTSSLPVQSWNLDGGNPTSVYGGTTPIDGGSP